MEWRPCILAGSKSAVVWTAVVIIGIGIAWLAAGRRISLILDRFATIHVETLPVTPLAYDITSLRIGGNSMELIGTDNQRIDLEVQTNSQGRVVFSRAGKSFILGPRLDSPRGPGEPAIRFNSEPGDEISFVHKRSAISQPTPFEINFMGGSSPSWRRYVYYRLVWRKKSGGRLRIVWRYEQQYYSATGWTGPNMKYDFLTGLIRIDIQ